MPVNPNTAKQSAVRNNIQELSQAWKDLTVSQRTGWIALGAQMTRQDSLGQAYNLTGLQAFTSLNMNLKTAGASALFDAPALHAVNQLDSITVTATSS